MALFDELAAGSSKMVNSSSQTVNFLDPLTDQFKVINSDDSIVNIGRFFELSVQKIISSGGTYDISVTISTIGVTHFRNVMIASSLGDVIIDFYEGNTISGGASVTAYNHNRTVAGTSSSTIVTSAIITALGTLIKKSYVPGITGSAKIAGGGQLTESVGWVLAQGQNYNWRLTSNASGANTVNFNALGYNIS